MGRISGTLRYVEVVSTLFESMTPSPNQSPSGVNRAAYFPQLSTSFINALLIENVKKLVLGVKCGELILALFKFADDVALIAETEKDLQ